MSIGPVISIPQNKYIMDTLNTFVPHTENWKEETFFWITNKCIPSPENKAQPICRNYWFQSRKFFFFQLTGFIVFGLHITKWKLFSHIQLFETPWTIQSMEFSRPETGTGSLSLLQGIFPTQGWNPGLPHWRWILYQEDLNSFCVLLPFFKQEL